MSGSFSTDAIICIYMLLKYLDVSHFINYSDVAVWAGLQQPLSHGLKFVNALFGVAPPYLAKGLVFVAARLHILSVDQVIGGLLALVYSSSQLSAQELKENTNTQWIRSPFLRIFGRPFRSFAPLQSPLYSTQSPSENTPLCIVIKFSSVLSPLFCTISCLGCEIQTNVISFVTGQGLDEICELNETNRMIMY